MKQAAIFPGQGAQKPGMGADLYERFPEARELFDRADEVLDFPISRTCFEGPAETVNRTDVCQPGIYLVGAVTMELLKRHRGIEASSRPAPASPSASTPHSGSPGPSRSKTACRSPASVAS